MVGNILNLQSDCRLSYRRLGNQDSQIQNLDEIEKDGRHSIFVLFYEYGSFTWVQLREKLIWRRSRCWLRQSGWILWAMSRSFFYLSDVFYFFCSSDSCYISDSYDIISTVIFVWYCFSLQLKQTITPPAFSSPPHSTTSAHAFHRFLPFKEKALNEITGVIMRSFGRDVSQEERVDYLWSWSMGAWRLMERCVRLPKPQAQS